MDDFLVKPVTMIALRQAIARWLPTGHEDQTPEQSVATITVEASTADALDKQALLQRFGSAAVVSQIVESLVPTLHEDLDALHAAIKRLDAPEASERLHRIIGGVGTIGATALAQRARVLMDVIEQSGTIPADETPAAFLQTASTYVRQLDSLR
jgi:two-component system sensor histidine kinase EvgS